MEMSVWFELTVLVNQQLTPIYVASISAIQTNPSLSKRSFSWANIRLDRGIRKAKGWQLEQNKGGKKKEKQERRERKVRGKEK